MFKFEKLTVWRKALDFADEVYTLSQAFPTDERFGLTNQMRRAATSVPSNIAEGSARPDPDFVRFIGYATGSLYEVVTQAFLARRRGFVGEDAFLKLYSDADEIGRMLAGLRESLWA